MNFLKELKQRAKKLNDTIQEQMTVIKNQEKTIKENKEKLKQQEDMNQVVAEKFILEEDLTEKQRGTVINQFAKWEPNVAYQVDDIIQYNRDLYQVIQSHTSQSNWAPDIVPALFNPYQPQTIENEAGEETEIIPEFEQPTSTNYYNTGDKVRFNGSIYESTIDTNTYSPTQYPQGWKLVE